ncbi:MAG: STAS domain-containing protein [Chloroflexi bacterium]|nr:STAS domain-containing protein [Chloroflexota bacterium]
MALKISLKEYKRVDLLAVDGRIDSSTAPQLDKALQKIIDAGRFRIVVDLSDAAFMSSAGLRALLSALKQVRRFNRGDLRLAGVSPKVKKAFELAGLLVVFQVFDNSVDAVGSF